LQDSYVEFLTSGGFIELESEKQRISDEEVAEDMPNIPEKDFGIRLLAETLNKADDALELFENTSQYA
jgi:hypothetical protein